MGRSVKAQMKYADKIGARYSMILGENELAEGTAQLKNMKTGAQTAIRLDDSAVGALSDTVFFEGYEITEEEH